MKETLSNQLQSAVNLLQMNTTNEEKFVGLLLIPKLLSHFDRSTGYGEKEQISKENDPLLFVHDHMNYAFLKKLLTSPGWSRHYFS